MGRPKGRPSKKRVPSSDSISGIPFGAFLKAGFSFAFRPKRFLPFFILGLIQLFAEVAFISVGIGTDSLMAYAEFGIPDAQVPLFAGLAFVQLVGWIVGLIITGAVLHQAANPSDCRKSWTVALRRLPALAAASFIIILLSLSVSTISMVSANEILLFVAAVLSVIITLAFLFVNQFIVLSGVRFDRAFTGSVKLLFRKPAGTILSCVLMWAAGLLLIAAFAAPMTIMLYAYFGADVPDVLSAATLFSGGGMEMKAVFLLSLLGESIAKVFMLKFLADVYLAFHKKKWIVF
jgi:hypothetical protein